MQSPSSLDFFYKSLSLFTDLPNTPFFQHEFYHHSQPLSLETGLHYSYIPYLYFSQSDSPNMTILHTTVLHKLDFFYPVGNTPPVFLTETLAPEEVAKILLLGCGDPRSILFTIYLATFGGMKPILLSSDSYLWDEITNGMPNIHCFKL